MVRCARWSPLGISGPETLGQYAVAQAPVAHCQRLHTQLVHDRADDAGTREDHFRAVWLQSDDAATGRCVHRSVEFDLAVEFAAIDRAALNHRRIVGRQMMAHGGDIGHRAAHGRERGAQHFWGDDPGEPEALGVAYGADIDAEALVDGGVVPEGELRAAAAGVEDDHATPLEPEPGPCGDEGKPRLLVARDDLDGRAAARLDGSDDLRAVGRHAQAGRADGGNRAHAVAPRLLGHARDGRSGALAGHVEDRAAGLQPFTQSRDLGAVDKRAPAAVRGPLGDVELDRSVIALAAMLAHEIKNPLSGIRGAAQLLEQQASSEDRMLTRLICDEADRIVTLVDRMEVFGDDRPVARGPVNIHSVLDHVKRLAQSGFARNVKFVEEYDPSLPPVLANQDQLIQVFLNLVKNAAEAVADLGADAEIQLTTAFRPGVRLSVPGKKTRVSLPLEFCVKDNGSGVPEDLLPNLFDPFVTTKQTGSGLGLALVAKIVGDHGGIIECESQPRKTTFRVLMPMYSSTKPQPDPSKRDDVPGTPAPASQDTR